MTGPEPRDRGLRSALLGANPFAVAVGQIVLMLASGVLLTQGQPALGVLLLLAVTVSNAWLARTRGSGRQGRRP